MTSRPIAALIRFAAICGLLLAPSAAAGQLTCTNPETDTQIRSVSFEGNVTFSDEELERHVLSTETDITRRYFNRRVSVPAGVIVGAGLAAWWSEKKLERGLIFGGIGGVLGYVVGGMSGIPRCLRPGTLAADIINLSGFYREQGFGDVRVDTTTSIDGRWVDVTFHVNEGMPALVDSLAIIGFDTTRMGPLPTSLRSEVGSRYSPTLTQEDVDTLETRLRNSGFPEGKALREARLEERRARVRFTIEPGPRARIGKITIDHQTLEGRKASVRDEVIRGMLLFSEGDYYNQRELFESERRFYRVGTFLSAEVAPDVSHVYADSLVDVRVTVLEDLTHVTNIEPGLGTLDCFRVRGSYTDKAFLGGVTRVDLSGSVSKLGLAPPTDGSFVSDICERLQNNRATGDDNATVADPSSEAVNYNGTLRVSRPIPFRGGLLPSVSVYTEKRGGYLAYLRTTQIGGAATVSKALTRTVSFEGSYNLEFGHTKAAETVLCFLFQACDESARNALTGGNKRLAVLGARFSRDRRNFLDSASAGTLLRLDVRTSQPFIGTDRSLIFNKAVVDAGWYRRVLGNGVLAVRARAGIVGGGDLINDTRLPPPQERLYSGGENSVRGFRQNELGPLIYVTNDDPTAAQNAPDDATRAAELQKLRMRVIPAGGNAMYVGNVEYRIPTRLFRLFQPIVFLDVGAVSSQQNLNIVADNQARWTPGIAFKYFSPVGAVQVNVGYNGYDRPNGAVYSDRDPSVLACISGTRNGQCQPLRAIAPVPRSKFFRHLTLTVAFPPDF